MSASIDHLVYATPDLLSTVERLGSDHGIELMPGGPHIGRGTRNYLAGLGGATYLEVIGPDPDQPTPVSPRPFGVDTLTHARLTAWCVSPGRPLPDVVHAVAAAGGDLGVVLPMSRKRPDGVLLEWELTVASMVDNDGVTPFCIDWLESPHPSTTLSHGTTLVSLDLTHPNAAAVRAVVAAIGLDVSVGEGAPGLSAVLRSPKGTFTLV